MKALGLDLGSRTVGVAISDKFGILASAYNTYRMNDDDYEDAARYVIEVCKKEKVEAVVLGYPKHMNNDVGIRAKISEDFKVLLEKELTIPIILQDERLTTSMVNNIMIAGNVRREKRKQVKDELAAVVILQGYLDTRRK